MTRFLARLFYWPALLAMIPTDVISIITNGNGRLLCFIVGAAASSLILYCKTYDWLVILALKRKRKDKELGINTGCYFILVMTIASITFFYSYTGLTILFKNEGVNAAILTIMAMLVFQYAKNLYDAYKSDPDEVLNSLGYYD